jgi:hypothetical protein
VPAAELRSPAQNSAGLMLVLGASGSGTSSLARAGLLPTLAAEPGWWVLPPMLPGANPTGQLAQALWAAARQLHLPWTLGRINSRLRAPDGGRRHRRAVPAPASPSPRRHQRRVA